VFAPCPYGGAVCGFVRAQDKSTRIAGAPPRRSSGRVSKRSRCSWSTRRTVTGGTHPLRAPEGHPRGISGRNVAFVSQPKPRQRPTAMRRARSARPTPVLANGCASDPMISETERGAPRRSAAWLRQWRHAGRLLTRRAPAARGIGGGGGGRGAVPALGNPGAPQVADRFQRAGACRSQSPCSRTSDG